MHQSWIDHDPVLRSVKEIGEVTEVSVAPSNAIAGAVLIQDDHLRGREPPEGDVLVLHAELEAARLENAEEVSVRLSPRLDAHEFLHSVLASAISN